MTAPRSLRERYVRAGAAGWAAGFVLALAVAVLLAVFATAAPLATVIVSVVVGSTAPVAGVAIGIGNVDYRREVEQLAELTRPTGDDRS